MRTPETGYSLYELLMTLLLTALVFTIGVPSLSGSVARNRQTAEIDALFHAVHVARKESIMRKRVVSICPTADGERCKLGRDWSAGWLMFDNLDADEPPQVDEGEAILTRHSVDSSLQITTNRRGFTLRSTVRRATNGTIVVCDRAGRIRAKALVISYTGRPRVTSRKRSGEHYSCAD